MKNRTFRALSCIALAFIGLVMAWELISELQRLHERSAVRAIAAALAADLRAGADPNAIFHQSRSPYRMAGESYADWMEEKHRKGALDSTNNDFMVDTWGNRYEISADASNDGSIKLSVSSSGKDGQFGTDDDIVEHSVSHYEKVLPTPTVAASSFATPTAVQTSRHDSSH